MIKKTIVAVLIYCLAYSVMCQDFKFERVIECENNDFQVVQQNDGEGAQLHDGSRQTQNEEQLTHFSQQSQGQKSQQPIKKAVRCKKWVESYKLVKKNNLRKTDQQSLPQVVYQQFRKPLKSIEKRGLISSQQLQSSQASQPQSQVSKEVGVSYSSSSYGNNQEEQVAQLMSLYFHYTMMNDILVYTGG